MQNTKKNESPTKTQQSEMKNSNPNSCPNLKPVFMSSNVCSHVSSLRIICIYNNSLKNNSFLSQKNYLVTYFSCELAALHSFIITVLYLSKEFFKVLDKVRYIHENCKILLRTNQQTAG